MLAAFQPLRRVVLPVLAKIGSRDISIRHHHTGTHFVLHAFKHRGYWYFGKQREAQTVASFRKVISSGDTIIEVGGHIGYMSVLFASLTGPHGKVFVFEPGSNFPYIRKNILSFANITLIEMAAMRQSGDIVFYTEELSGQNNTARADFPALRNNCERAGFTAGYQQTTVTAVTIDEFVDDAGISPAILKIDVEGSELDVLRGASATIRKFRPKLMVEVNPDAGEAAALFHSSGYRILDDSLQEVNSIGKQVANYFCFPR